VYRVAVNGNRDEEYEKQGTRGQENKGTRNREYVPEREFAEFSFSDTGPLRKIPNRLLLPA
jgi:hypothetical protein